MKKLKLFLSICTLCLCFAVLCIGIYAAQTVTYTISGTISYTVSDVFATISAKVFKVSGQQSADTMQTNVDTLATTAFSNIDTNTYIEDTTNTIEEYDTTSSNTASRTVAITIDNTYMTYYIVINIANLADRAISAKLTDSTTYTNLNNANKLIQNGIAKGETKNLVVAFSLADKKVGIENLAVSYSIAVRYGNFTFVDGLTADTTNSYWYVELGQKSSSDTTKLKWRYVGDYLTSSDGTETFTKYDYSTTKPTIGSGSVFVQQTPITGVSDQWGSYSSARNYFTECTLRKDIRNGSLLNLTTEEKTYMTSGYIKARTLDDLSWSCYNWDDETFTYPYIDSSHTTLTSTTKGTDYFWLMSVDEIYSYFISSVNKVNETTNTPHSEFSWDYTSAGWVNFSLRSPCCQIDSTEEEGSYGHYVTYVNLDGSFGFKSGNSAYGIRAGFQLA